MNSPLRYLGFLLCLPFCGCAVWHALSAERDRLRQTMISLHPERQADYQRMDLFQLRGEYDAELLRRTGTNGFQQVRITP
jgi:hypothetical protein